MMAPALLRKAYEAVSLDILAHVLLSAQEQWLTQN